MLHLRPSATSAVKYCIRWGDGEDRGVSIPVPNGWFKVEFGDFTTPRRGKDLSAITRIETCINQHLAYAQFHAAKIIPDFVLWFMQTDYDYFRSIAHGGGSTKGALTCGFLKTLPIPVPSRVGHEEVAATFQTLDDKETAAASKGTVLQDLFRTFLHELITAKTRVHKLVILA